MAAEGAPVEDEDGLVDVCGEVAGPAGVAPPNAPSLAGTM
jgi:hypothetical protein